MGEATFDHRAGDGDCVSCAADSPDGFWNAVFSGFDAGSMAEKYEWLCCRVLDARGPVRAGDLREAARRWPGALRECQRVSPKRYRERESASRRGAAAAPRSRASWRAQGYGAVCLWSELHRLHADVARWRANGPRGRRPRDFLCDLTDRDLERRAAWPAWSAVEGWAFSTVGVALAERCLGHRAGLSREQLRRCLLDGA